MKKGSTILMAAVMVLGSLASCSFGDDKRTGPTKDEMEKKLEEQNERFKNMDEDEKAEIKSALDSMTNMIDTSSKDIYLKDGETHEQD